MRQTPLNLSEEDRLVIEEIRSKGLHQAREVNHAHVLSCLDRGIPEAQIIAVLGMGRTAVWRAQGVRASTIPTPRRTCRPWRHVMWCIGALTRIGSRGVIMFRNLRVDVLVLQHR